ncbi:melatonin receptor type 1C-like [Protopterus annectens]|uniref:melatonin receptor type 1C-like n=1 Tax=Protopterus annectens TaxID=7888 RepID=UPI001CFAAF13|nr:melatonin receptor type 1C-like [Protopterus annectens]
MLSFNVTSVNCAQRANNTTIQKANLSTSGTIALATVVIFTIVMDVIGNVLVVLSVLRNKKLRNTGNIFVVSLSVVDLIVAFYPYPLILIAILNDGWIMGDVHCFVSGLVLSLSVIGSVFHITAIAINRYFCICHSQLYDKLYSMKNTYYYVAALWVLTVAAYLPLYFFHSLQYDPRLFSCTFIWSVSSSSTITVEVAHFLVPISVVIFCYARIWILVIQVKYKVRQDSKQKLKPNEVRQFIVMFVVFVLFASCWGPFSILGLAVGFNPTQMAPKIPDWLLIFCHFLAYFNSCLNGLVYGVLNRNFQREYKQIILMLCTSKWLFQDSFKCWAL